MDSTCSSHKNHSHSTISFSLNFFFFFIKALWIIDGEMSLNPEIQERNLWINERIGEAQEGFWPHFWSESERDLVEWKINREGGE